MASLQARFIDWILPVVRGSKRGLSGVSRMAAWCANHTPVPAEAVAAPAPRVLDRAGATLCMPG
jgi:hypothetical protein